MFQAPHDMASRWPGADIEAINYLKERGFKLSRDWQWILPHPLHQVTDVEYDAIQYLILEWDFDGLAGITP